MTSSGTSNASPARCGCGRRRRGWSARNGARESPSIARERWRFRWNDVAKAEPWPCDVGREVERGWRAPPTLPPPRAASVATPPPRRRRIAPRISPPPPSTSQTRSPHPHAGVRASPTAPHEAAARMALRPRGAPSTLSASPTRSVASSFAFSRPPWRPVSLGRRRRVLCECQTVRWTHSWHAAHPQRGALIEDHRQRRAPAVERRPVNAAPLAEGEQRRRLRALRVRRYTPPDRPGRPARRGRADSSRRTTAPPGYRRWRRAGALRPPHRKPLNASPGRDIGPRTSV
jgi:hypothetical protein